MGDIGGLFWLWALMAAFTYLYLKKGKKINKRKEKDKKTTKILLLDKNYIEIIFE